MSLNKSVLKHTAIYSFASVLGKAAGFIMLPFYAHLLGSEGYGVIGMLDAGLNFFMIMLAYGLGEALIRYYNEETDKKDKNAVISTGIILIWMVALPITLCITTISIPISSFWLGDPSYSLLVILSVIAFALNMSARTASIILFIEQKSLLYSSIRFLRLIVCLSLNVYLVVILKQGLIGFFISGLITSLMASLVFNYIAFKKCGFTFCRNIARKLIFFELPLMLGNLFSFISRQTERVLLRFLINIKSVGILEVAYKFPVILPMFFSLPFMQSWAPKRMEIADKKNSSLIMSTMYTQFLFIMLFIGVLIAANVKDVLYILTPEEFHPAAGIAVVEIVSLILRDSYYHLYFGLFYAKKTKQLAFINTITSGIKIPISFFMITMWGLQGAAYAALITTLISCVWVNHKSQAYYKIPFEWKKIYLMVFMAISIYITLSLSTFSETNLVAVIRDSSIQPIRSLLELTGLAAVKHGVIVKIIEFKLNHVIAIFLNSFVCLSMFLLLPVINPDMAVNWISRISTARAVAKPCVNQKI